MPAIGRLVTLGLFAGLAVLGLALGAESQREVFLEPDPEARDAENAQGAAGNLVAATATLVAAGVAGAAALLSRRTPKRRLLPVAVLAGATYFGVVLGQTAWPNYIVHPDSRFATLTNSLLAANLDSVPSLLGPVLALVLGCLLAAGWACRRLFGKDLASGDPESFAWGERLLRAQVGATLLATPFLGLVAWGNVRLLLALPADQPGLGPYFVVLPAAALGCLALAALAALKTWHLGSSVRNARLAGPALEAWQTLGRLEGAIAVVLGALALAGTFLEPATLRDLELGRTFSVTLRGHMQSLVLLAIPLAPLFALDRWVARILAQAPLHGGTLDDGTHPLAAATVFAATASVALAAVGTWALPDALWPWAMAIAPCALVSALRTGPVPSAVPVLLLAFVLWAIGNTVEATYDGTRQALLLFAHPPGLLALWRTLGALLAAIALTRLARGLGLPGALTWPLAAGTGLALAAVALLEMPLTAWLTNRAGGEAIAVGSVLASQDTAVRATIHTIATALALAAALLVALLHRPEWFGRRPGKPVAVVRPKPRRTRTPNAADEAADGTRAGAPPRRTPA